MEQYRIDAIGREIAMQARDAVGATTIISAISRLLDRGLVDSCRADFRYFPKSSAVDYRLTDAGRIALGEMP
jgi:hypothetical protein